MSNAANNGGLIRRVGELQREVERALKTPGAFPYLPEIAGVLGQIAECLKAGSLMGKPVRSYVGALGRLVTEDHAFSESPLGTSLLDIGDEVLGCSDPANCTPGSEAPEKGENEAADGQKRGD